MLRLTAIVIGGSEETESKLIYCSEQREGYAGRDGVIERENEQIEREMRELEGQE